MIYKDCFFFESNNGITAEYGLKEDGSPLANFLENGLYSIVKTPTGLIKKIVEYNKDGYQINEYLPSRKCKVIQ